MQIGQDDSAGDMRATHDCWHCGYSEIDKNWSRPLRTDGQSAADRLLRLRLGVEIPLVYDTSKFPEEVW